MTPQRFGRLTSVLSHRQPDLTVVLENVFDPHNVSAVMRTCDAVGIQDIYILNDRIPPHKKWGYRSSSTATEWLTVHQFTDAEICFEEVRRKYQKIYTSHLDEKSADVYKIDLTQSIALVFGNETFGVSEGIRKYSDGDFIIPQMGIIKSLNISVACAVTLYEAFRQKKEKGHYEKPRLQELERNEIEKKWGIS
ncbi:MAG: RNA methyltransferase [Bacteroidota bacterium]|nr:RNA methyltransferase [Bacteroidota bacterium]